MPLDVRITPSWRELRCRLDAVRQNQPTPFQAQPWLDAWYDTLPRRDDITALPLEIVDTATDKTVAALPLIKQRQGAFTVVAFADLSITDYNTPVFAPDARLADTDVDQILTRLAQRVPDADILHLAKMPAEIHRSPNPFASLPRASLSLLNANVLTIDGTWEDYRRKRLAKKVRKELERSWRVFERDAEDARFETIRDVDEALGLLPVLEALHERRIAELNDTYVLKDDPYRAFYRALIREGLTSGDVSFTVSRDGPNRLVAGLIGLRVAETFAMVRMAQDFENWPQCSPGRLVIDQTIQALFADGVRVFDFTTGDYAYKDAFAVEHQPLYDLKMPLSVRGRFHLGRENMIEGVKSQVRRHPRLYEKLKAITGRRD